MPLLVKFEGDYGCLPRVGPHSSPQLFSSPAGPIQQAAAKPSKLRKKPHSQTAPVVGSPTGTIAKNRFVFPALNSVGVLSGTKTMVKALGRFLLPKKQLQAIAEPIQETPDVMLPVPVPPYRIYHGLDSVDTLPVYTPPQGYSILSSERTASEVL